MVERFCTDTGLRTTRPVDTPHVSAESWAQDSEEAGRFADVAASHSVLSLLLPCWKARPGCIRAAIVQRCVTLDHLSTILHSFVA
eukprot:6169368-Pyramimonas_sp.AAC.1